MLAPAVFHIGQWELRCARDELVHGTRTVKLEPRVALLLRVLAEARGEVVENHALLAAVWGPVVVTSGSIYEAVARLRRVLGDDHIATVPRRGYRLVAPVRLPAPAPRLAVRPFRADSLPAEWAPLRERVLEGLINALARSAPCTVIARGTMLASPDPRELGVQYVIDGRIEARVDALALHAELVDAERGELIWTEAVEAPAADGAAAVQPLVERLARVLNFRLAEALVGPEVHRLGPSRQLAMRSWVELYCRPQSRTTNDAAWRLADEALRLDAADPLARLSMAYAGWRAANHGWHDGDREPLFDAVLDHVRCALEGGPEQADAYFTRALVAFSRGDFVGCEEGMRHAIHCVPSHAAAYGLLGRIRCVLGHPEETAPLVQRALAISPLEPLRAVWHWIDARAALVLHEHERAHTLAQRALALNPDHAHSHYTAIAAAQAMGDAALVTRALHSLRRHLPEAASIAGWERISPPRTGGPFVQQRDEMKAWLQAAGLPP